MPRKVHFTMMFTRNIFGRQILNAVWHPEHWLGGKKIFNKEPRGTFALKIQYIRLFATRKTSTTIDRNASGYTCFF